MLYFIPILFAYLLGAVPFGVIVSRFFGVKDIKSVGSGNIGATNVWRVIGFKAAIWVFVGDIGKGILAVLLAQYFVSNYELVFISKELFLVICAVSAVIGHIFSVYIGFKGGKGVNTALGTVIMLLPQESLISLFFFIITLSLFKYVSLSSIVGAISLFLAVLIEKYFLNMEIALVYFFLSLVLALGIILSHHKNISRIISGTENRFSIIPKTGGQ